MRCRNIRPKKGSKHAFFLTKLRKFNKKKENFGRKNTPKCTLFAKICIFFARNFALYENKRKFAALYYSK